MEMYTTGRLSIHYFYKTSAIQSQKKTNLKQIQGEI